jgi:hypothetical protein
MGPVGYEKLGDAPRPGKTTGALLDHEVQRLYPEGQPAFRTAQISHDNPFDTLARSLSLSHCPKIYPGGLTGKLPVVFHVELRKFPHSFWRFNLSQQELNDSILAPWVRGVPVEAGERRWNPQEATITVLEGPTLEVHDLSMGRGWRNATRRGEDVTARLLADAREAARRQATPRDAAPAPGQPSTTAPSTSEARRARESEARLMALLGEDAETLIGLWRAARERHPERTASECLALAERAVRTLEDR